VLSPLQRRVASLLAQLPEASNFVLAGGAALITHGEIGRRTRDLDFFTVDPPQVDQLVPIFEAAVRSAGLAVIEVQVVAGFARLVVVPGEAPPDIGRRRRYRTAAGPWRWDPSGTS